MKYAICFRGISYHKDYVWLEQQYSIEEHGHKITPYDIDFSHCIPFFRKNLIDPLLNKGHDIDVFFNTYKSEKISQFTEEMKPVASRTVDFDPDVRAHNHGHIYQTHADSLGLVKEYQDANGIEYDFVIVVRFDAFITRDFSEIFTPKGAVSIVTAADDAFIVFSKGLIRQAMSVFLESVPKGEWLSIHNFPDELIKAGIKVHVMFGINLPGVWNGMANDHNAAMIGNSPFVRNARETFYSHRAVCRVEDIDNESSPYYALKHSPNEKFTTARQLEWI